MITENWEEEFDVFIDHDNKVPSGLVHWKTSEVKNFIRSLLSSQRQVLIKEVEEMIEKMFELKNKKNFKEFGHCSQCDYLVGFNSSLTNLKEKLTKLG